MLIRKQILLEEKQIFELEALAAYHNMSFSKIMRKGANMITKKIKAVKKTAREKTGTEFLLEQAKKAVSGPGDSEYDKYAYDL